MASRYRGLGAGRRARVGRSCCAAPTAAGCPLERSGSSSSVAGARLALCRQFLDSPSYNRDRTIGVKRRCIAVARTWIVHGDESRWRRGRDVDLPQAGRDRGTWKFGRDRERGKPPRRRDEGRVSAVARTREPAGPRERVRPRQAAGRFFRAELFSARRFRPGSSLPNAGVVLCVVVIKAPQGGGYPHEIHERPGAWSRSGSTLSHSDGLALGGESSG